MGQEAFVAAFRGAAGFCADDRPLGWMLTIARHRALRHLRARPVFGAEEESLERLALDPGFGASEGPERSAEREETRAALANALSSLSPDDRPVIVLHDLEELSGQETADVLELSLAAMKSRLHRARLRLMLALRRGGLTRA